METQKNRKLPFGLKFPDKSMRKEFIIFFLNGCLMFLVDMLLLVFFTEVVGFNYLLSAAISFAIASTLNFIVSRHIIFKPGIHKMHTEFNLFMIFSLIALGLNEAVMWFFTDLIGLYYPISKVIASASVGIFNFIVRREVIFKKIGKSVPIMDKE